jgi:hypothetical protein
VPKLQFSCARGNLMIYDSFGAAHFTLPALVCMTFQAFRLKLGTAYFRYEFVIAAVHAKAISAFVVPEGKGRGINVDPSTGTAAPLKKLAAKHNVRLHFEFRSRSSDAISLDTRTR